MPFLENKVLRNDWASIFGLLVELSNLVEAFVTLFLTPSDVDFQLLFWIFLAFGYAGTLADFIPNKYLNLAAKIIIEITQVKWTHLLTIRCWAMFFLRNYLGFH